MTPKTSSSSEPVTAAWRRERHAAAAPGPPAPGEDPDLRLRVIHEDAEAITAEVLGGETELRRTLLYVERRGFFAVVAMLARPERGMRLYLRLRPFGCGLEWQA